MLFRSCHSIRTWPFDGGAKNPTAHVVMGAVLESRGKKTEALTEYETAVHQMTREELQNEFLPIAVAESA